MIDKDEILAALVVAFLSSIVSLILAFILIFSIDSFDGIPENYMYWISIFIPIVFIFCGAYVGFSRCYFGKIYVSTWNPALIVATSFVIILGAIALIPIADEPIECCARHRAFDAAALELNAREKLWWERVKKSGRQYQNDAEIDREIVTGINGGGWDTDLGQDYTWTVGPTAEGGTISFQLRDSAKLSRKAATFNAPATWYK
ncbi:MAG: hypothetical protein JSU83_07455 [Deltaproteobacteria bacterium]|nr:MAG: hypothetical protein JSU83_07455 [Deltaproteobacteria bacterium]